MYRLLVAAIVISGCAGLSDDGPAKPDLGLFEATFLAASGETLSLNLQAPREIAGPDLTLREAMPMQAVYVGANWTQTAIYWLDGDLRLVRADHPCGFVDARCGSANPEMQINWRPLGELAPFGIDWTAPHEVSTQHGHSTLPVQIREGKASIEAGHSRDYLADGLRSFEGGPIPTRITHQFLDDAPISFSRTSISVHSALPKIAAWPYYSDLLRAPLGDVEYFAGENLEVFDAGITWLDAYAALDELAPDFRSAGCLSYLFTVWAGGVRGSPLALIDRDDIWFIFAVSGDRQTQRADLRYSQSTLGDKIPALGAWSLEDVTTHDTTFDCQARTDVQHITTPHDFVAEAWALPLLESGFPCDVITTTNPYGTWPGPAIGGHEWSSILAKVENNGDPFGMKPTGYSVSKNAATNLWAGMNIAPGDVTALDSGFADLEPRPAPDRTVDGRFNPYRCHPPSGEPL